MPAVDTSSRAGIDDIKFSELQISAVKIDMHRYLGWFPDDKELLRKASLKAIDDLAAIKVYLGQITLGGREKQLAETNISIINKLMQIYDGIAKKDAEAVRMEFKEYVAMYYQYEKDYETVTGQNSPFEVASWALPATL